VVANLGGMTMISADDRYKKKSLKVLGQSMIYKEAGQGEPIVFLHGNPTSSYLWRNVIPHLEDLGRCIAPDLIGMGDSAKLEPSGPDRYTFEEHRQYIEALLDGLNISDKVTFVVHDWGSALGFDWANRHRKAVKGIAYMEAIVRPLTWDEWPKQVRRIIRGIRSEAGEEMILERNLFVERILPTSIIRAPIDLEIAEYRRPYLEPGEGRRPTLTWPRQLPIDGKPQNVVEIVDSYAKWLAQSKIPKLFINAEPGGILIGAQREFCRTWPNQREVTVKGMHYIQEDSPEEIGKAIAQWYVSL
jgi:haloalkane dehalogenase